MVLFVFVQAKYQNISFCNPWRNVSLAVCQLFFVLIIVYERTVQCRRAGWCWWLLVDVVSLPFCGLGDEIRTESLQRSTDTEPPLHQRRTAAETDLTQSPVREKTCILPSTCDTTEYTQMKNHLICK